MVRSFGALLMMLWLGCVSVKRGGSDGSMATTGSGGSGGSGSGGSRDSAPSERTIGGPPLGDAACATRTQQAEKLPLDMYILMDSSASMDDMTTAGPTKWEAVRAAVVAFINDQQSAGLGVGLQYFPLVHAGVPDQCTVAADCGQWGPCIETKACSGGTAIRLCDTAATCGIGQTCDLLGICAVSTAICSPAGPGFFCPGAEGECLPLFPYCGQRDVCETPPYATPAVPIAALPAAAPALIASLMGHMPDGFTPTSAALSGGIAHAQARARSTPGRRVVVVMATDGLPSECLPTDIAGVAAVAAAGRMGTPSVSTFVIGVFGTREMATAQPNLDQLAAAGGTQKAFIISTGQNVTQAFQMALNNVRT
ncbi:MAG TPA: hypothetical protein VFH73_10610, partial [Polyangia bacterium]|nr:hypothetical protein [Polyangia bacterium]